MKTVKDYPDFIGMDESGMFEELCTCDKCAERLANIKMELEPLVKIATYQEMLELAGNLEGGQILIAIPLFPGDPRIRN